MKKWLEQNVSQMLCSLGFIIDVTIIGAMETYKIAKNMFFWPMTFNNLQRDFMRLLRQLLERQSEYVYEFSSYYISFRGKTPNMIGLFG